MGTVVAVARWRDGDALPTIEERVEAHLEDGTYTLHVCPHAWAQRHQFVNKVTGERRRFRCGLWSCAYCGPRKVDEWRQVIAEADPKLHLVLTKAGHTLEEAARRLTTFMQALRRGSKGRGRGHWGARQAYPVEYLAVLEEHADFEQNGFHWHILIARVDYIPHEVLRDLWISATGGRASIVYVKRVEKQRAIGYVTKYLMKDIFKERKGVKRVCGEVVTGLGYSEDGSLLLDREGHVVLDAVSFEEERESKARRIRYSRHFFPESTKQIRKRLFSVHESTQEEDGDEQEPLSEELQERIASSWELVEVAPPARTEEEYNELLRKNLTWAVRDYVDTGRRLSVRVVRMWDYHRYLHSYDPEYASLYATG